MISVARQVFNETLRYCVFPGQADDRASTQRAAFEGAWQHSPPEHSVREQCCGAQSPEQQDVSSRQVVTNSPGKYTGGQDKERSAPGAQDAARLVVHENQAVGAIKLLHAHSCDKKDRYKRRRSYRVGKFASKIVGKRVIKNFGPDRASENQGEVDRQGCRRDRAIGNREAPR